MSAIDAFVTNLGRYNEGFLDGEFLKLPATTEEVQALFQRIHVDGVQYEEIFITDYETKVSGLYDCLPEYADLDELNYFAALLDDLDEGDREKFEAALSCGDHTSSLAKSIHVSVITVQKAYEDLQRDGFIETTVGRGSFVSAQNKDFFQEEQQRKAEEYLQEAADIARTSGISLDKLIELLSMFYQGEE